MKKLVLILLIMALAFPVFAQEAKNIMAGNILIGGDLSVSPYFGHYVYEFDGEEMAASERNEFGLSIDALAGFFLVDSLELGVAVGFWYEHRKYKESEDVYTDFVIALGPQIGYFFNTYSNLVPYVGAAVLYYSYTDKYTPASGEGSETKYNGFIIEPRGGLNIFISPSVALAATLFFQYQPVTEKDSDPEEVDKYTEFGLRLGFNVFL